MKAGLALVVIVGLVAGGWAYLASDTSAEHPQGFRTAIVKRGDLNPTISATGTLEPEEVVDVGAQVAGKIYALGRDPRDASKWIDYGSIVEVGTDLAYIDDAVYQSHVDQAEASLQRAQADLLQAHANLELAEQDWRRADRLRPTRAMVEADYEQAVAKHKVAKANVAVMEAVIKQTEAALRLAKTNFAYTVIKSPVQGVIIDRRVNVGQTVVASLNAPSLFLIAKDLGRMQVWASVNEADIGRIQPGLSARFTVDTFPKRVFFGKVEQIRLNATMTQNVVTYTVVVVTDNPDGTLLPYLTANVQFEIDRRQNVLVVPNAALRWRPKAGQVTTAASETDSSASPNPTSTGSTGTVAERKSKAQTANVATDIGEQGLLWVKEGEGFRSIAVQVGATDGILTEVSGSDIREGMEVVVGEDRQNDRNDDTTTTNPFTPKMPR